MTLDSAASGQWPVTELIPHRPPMLLLDRVLAADPTQLWGSIELTATAPFATDAGVPSNIALEYLAQSAAAFFSLRGRSKPAALSPPPEPGMLIACLQLRAHRPYLQVPAQLLTHVQPASALPQSGGGLVRFRGTVTDISGLRSAPPNTSLDATKLASLATDEPLVTAEFSVYLPPPSGSEHPHE